MRVAASVATVLLARRPKLSSARNSVAKLLCVMLLATLTTGCGAITTRTDHFKLYVKHEGVQDFVVTNDKHPREPFAVVVRPHEATLNYSYHF